MKHPKLAAWEKKFTKALDKIDDYLEDKYGARYKLHPARARRGTTSNKKYDGLFSVNAAFSPGYGSKTGRGYIMRIRMVTLATVPPTVRERIQKEAARELRNILPKVLPGKKLEVTRDGRFFKIHGDLSLGQLKGKQ